MSERRLFAIIRRCQPCAGLFVGQETDTTMNARNDAAGQCLVLPLDQLHLDPENPRLPKGMRTADESAILQWMLVNGCLPGLMESIVSSGYCYAEPLLVVPAQDGYVVVEGNRRLAALRLLHKPELASLREKTIAQIADNARRRNILDIPVICCRNRQELPGYMGYRHTSCIKPWAPRGKDGASQATLSATQGRGRIGRRRSCLRIRNNRHKAHLCQASFGYADNR